MGRIKAGKTPKQKNGYKPPLEPLYPEYGRHLFTLNRLSCRLKFDAGVSICYVFTFDHELVYETPPVKHPKTAVDMAYLWISKNFEYTKNKDSTSGYAARILGKGATVKLSQQEVMALQTLLPRISETARLHKKLQNVREKHKKFIDDRIKYKEWVEAQRGAIELF